MRRHLPVLFWWWPGWATARWWVPYYWHMPRRDHLHLGPLGIYYTRALEEKAAARSAAEIAEEEADYQRFLAATWPEDETAYD